MRDEKEGEESGRELGINGSHLRMEYCGVRERKKKEKERMEEGGTRNKEREKGQSEEERKTLGVHWESSNFECVFEKFAFMIGTKNTCVRL